MNTTVSNHTAMK